jgi:hypothetical protein
MMACLPGAYPWDDWQKEALTSGLTPELAMLGRDVMREAYQHDWCESLKDECGIDNPDTAASMIACAKGQPHLMHDRWQWLMATDGLRFDPWKFQERPEDSPAWREMRRRWEAEMPEEKNLPQEAFLLREAYRYIENFYDLDQLAIIDLLKHAISHADGQTTLWADFCVIEGTPHRIAHSGVVRFELENDGSDSEAAIFKQVEET